MADGLGHCVEKGGWYPTNTPTASLLVLFVHNKKGCQVLLFNISTSINQVFISYLILNLLFQVKGSQTLLSNINRAICKQLKSFKYSYVIQIILFKIDNLFVHG